MSKILVTGHSGLLGNSLIHILEKQGHEVVGVSRTNRLNYQGKHILLDLADTQLPSGVEWLLQSEKPDIVYHLAANAAEAMSQKSPLDMTRRNLYMSINLLNECIKAKVKKFVYSSSVSVYGDASTPYLETAQPLPKDVYGVNKYAFEQVLHIMAKVYNFDFTIFRPHNIFGPGQNINDLSKNVVAVFMRKLMEDEGYTILGGNDVRRAFSYVEDVAEVFAVAADRLSGVTMNVGSTIPSTIHELSRALTEITQIDVPISFKPLRKQEISEFIADHKNQDSLVSYRETPFYVALSNTWEWTKQQELKPVVEHKKEI